MRFFYHFAFLLFLVGVTPIHAQVRFPRLSNELTPAQGRNNGNQGSATNRTAGTDNSSTNTGTVDNAGANPAGTNPSATGPGAGTDTGTATVGTGQGAGAAASNSRSPQNTRNYGEMEDYRRSSLCLIMLTHQGTRYAEEMQQQFLQIPLPSRYNPHNVSVRVISTPKGELSKDEIMNILRQRGVAKELVQKWFNYNSRTGTMNMDRIHSRGGYNASAADLERAQSTERGTAMLSDEGLELIQNTFVLVCDMSYYDRAKTGRMLSAILFGVAAGLDASAQQQARQGNYQQADNTRAVANLAAMGSVVAADVGGFSVKIYAHLFRLRWDNNLTQQMFNQYWIDDDTPAAERRQRKAAFEADSYSFQLDYVGKYKAKTGKTVFRSQNDMLDVIRRVCANTIDKGMDKLAKSYPIFRPKTAFFCQNGMVHAYIGTKEGVTRSSRYEVVRKQLKKGQFTYKKVDEARPLSVWDNRNVEIEQVDLSTTPGSTFRCKKGSVCDMGYLLREKK